MFIIYERHRQPRSNNKLQAITSQWHILGGCSEIDSSALTLPKISYRLTLVNLLFMPIRLLIMQQVLILYFTLPKGPIWVRHGHQCHEMHPEEVSRKPRYIVDFSVLNLSSVISCRRSCTRFSQFSVIMKTNIDMIVGVSLTPHVQAYSWVQGRYF